MALNSKTDSNKIIARWLFVCCGLVLAMVSLGGVTRLTGSGLSMVDWNPIMGAIPPLTFDDWQQVFQQYQKFPEFQITNSEMDLAGFKKIFLFEYAHRLLGRIIGLAFLLPFLYFLLRGYVSRSLWPKLLLMFVLGAAQGLLGWYMVKSGLVDNPHVSQYRLVAHLSLAVAIFAYMLWTGLTLLGAGGHEKRSVSDWRIRAVSVTCVIVIGLMIVSGGFVAGTRAGFIYNTFPTMNGEWLPAGLTALSPIWRNLFENTVTVQWLHRLLALLVTITIFGYWTLVQIGQRHRHWKFNANLIVLVLILQLVLGISTLLLQVPVIVAAAHQLGALLLLTVAIYNLHEVLDR